MSKGRQARSSDVDRPADHEVPTRAPDVRDPSDRLAYALETTGTGVWDLDLVDHTSYRSSEHDRIFGYERPLPEWSYETFLEHVLPEDRAEVDAKYRQATGEHRDWELECRIRRADGEIRWIRAAGRYRKDESGRVRTMAGIVQDITERKRATESEERLLALMDHNPSLVFLKDEAGRYVYLNAAYEERFVHSKDWYGKTDFDFWSKESAEMFRANDAAVLESGQTLQFLEDSTDQDGTRFCWLDYKFPFVDAQQRRYTGGIGIDATAFVGAEEALAAAKERDEFLLRVSDTLRQLDDPDEIKSEAARLLGEHLGMDRAFYAEFEGDEVLIARDWTRDVPSVAWRYPLTIREAGLMAAYSRGEDYSVSDVATDPRVDEGRRARFRQDRTGAFSGAALLKDGRPVAAFVVQSVEPHEWTPDEVELTRAVAERTWDGSKRAQAEAALREALTAERDARQQADDLVKYAPTGIYEFDFREGRITSVNDAMVALSGYSRDELLGMDPARLLTEDSAGLFAERTASTLAGEAPSQDVEYRVRRKDGAEIVAVLQARFMPDESGLPTRALVIGHDVTERRRLLEAEQRAARLASTLNHINEILLSTLTVGQMLEAVVAGTTQAVGADKAVVAELEADEFRILHASGFRGDLRGQRFPLAHFPTVRRAILSHESAFVEDTERTGDATRGLARQLGFRAFMMLPLLAGRRLIGGLAYAYDEPRRFDDQDVEFAGRLSLALSLALENARHFELERDIADRLQEALLALPEAIKGIEFAHAYHSATEAARVGGDFYDLFELNDDQVGVVIGDVAGKGLDAAVLTSMVKNTIRAHANEEGKTPARILDLTNDVIYKATTSEAFVTVFFGLLDRRDGRLVYANAGHTTAAVSCPESGTGKLEVTGPLLGAFDDAEFTESETHVGPGQLVFLYTDGVTEARRDGALYGEERLFDVLASLCGHGAADVVTEVIRDVLEFSGSRLRDDVAILALKLTPRGEEPVPQQRVEV